jgi:cell division protein FtsL
LIAVHERADYFYYEEMRRLQAPPPVVQPVREKQIRLPLTALLVMAFILGAAFSYVNALAVSVGYQAESLRAEIAKLEQEKQSLRARIDKLDSLSRVEVVAITQLGMVRPTPDDVMFVAVNGANFADPDTAPVGEPAAVAGAVPNLGRDVAERPARTREQGILQAFLDFAAR